MCVLSFIYTTGQNRTFLNNNNYSIKELQSYLRARGVTVTGHRRIGLLEIYRLAENVGNDINPIWIEIV